MKFTRACTACKLVYILLAAALAASLAACGAKEASTSASPIPQYTLPPVEEAEQPAQGGSLKFPIPPQNADAMNPLKVHNVELFNLYTLIYEQPVRIGTDGKAKPELAETWNVDATGTVWTFKLREGVQWQGDYGEFTSEDVIYTIDLIKTYTAEESTYAKYNNDIASYEATDAYTVTVTLSEPGYARDLFYDVSGRMQGLLRNGQRRQLDAARYWPLRSDGVRPADADDASYQSAVVETGAVYRDADRGLLRKQRRRADRVQAKHARFCDDPGANGGHIQEHVPFVRGLPHAVLRLHRSQRRERPFQRRVYAPGDRLCARQARHHLQGPARPRGCDGLPHTARFVPFGFIVQHL